MSTIVRTPAVVEYEIAAAMSKYRRLPAHWEARRIEQMAKVMRLVDERRAMTDTEHEEP